MSFCRNLLFTCLLLALLCPGCQQEPSSALEPDIYDAPQLPELTLSPDELLGNTDSWSDPAGPSLASAFVDISPAVLPNDYNVEAGNTAESIMGDLSGGFMADLDGDGRSEVVYGIQYCCEPDEKAQVFRLSEDDEELIHDPILSEAVQQLWGMTSAAIDLDGDTIPDLVGANPEMFLSWGEKDGTYSTPQHVPGAQELADNQTHQGSMIFHDIDRDGWLDILLTDHSCDENSVIFRPLLRTGLRMFEARTDLIDHSQETGSAYTTMAYDAPTGETVLFSIGQPCSPIDPNEGFMTSIIHPDDGYPRFSPQDITPGDSVYKTHPRVSYGPITVQRPMAATRADFDGDGIVDLMVSLFDYYALFEGTTSWPLKDRTADTGLTPPKGEGGRHMIPWGMISLDLDRDGREDVIIAHGDDDTSFYDPDPIGPQDVRAAWNGGDFSFQPFQDQTELSAPGNWRSLTVGDLEGDGDPDLVIGGFGLPPRVLKNTLNNGMNSLALRLKGTTSNHLGIGARIRLMNEEGSLGPVHSVGKNSSPMFVSDTLTFLGLGTEKKAHAIEIQWPSGMTQVVAALDAGMIHTIEEPQTISLSDNGRRLSIENDTALTILVTPRNPDGTLNPNAVVSIESVVGHKEFEGPIVETDEGFQRRLLPPGTPGESVIEVLIDGEAVGIRPRVWWTE